MAERLNQRGHADVVIQERCGVGVLRRHDHQPVDPAGEHGFDAFRLGSLVVAEAQQQLASRAVDFGLQLREQSGCQRVGRAGHDEADGIGRVAAQCAGGGVGLIVELFRRVPHAFRDVVVFGAAP